MIQFVEATTWRDVLDGWREREGKDPDWIHCATVVKGWSDWDSWRQFTAQQLGLPEREWAIYEFKDPMRNMPNMLVGPYRGWQHRLPKPNQHTFADLVRIPAQERELRKNSRVAAIRKRFPRSTVLIGLLKDSGQIVCVEGHHRTVAVALCAREGKKIDFGGRVRIALARLGEGDTGLLDRVLARGTSRDERS